MDTHIRKTIRNASDAQLRQFRAYRIGEYIAEYTINGFTLLFRTLLYLGYFMIAAFALYLASLLCIALHSSISQAMVHDVESIIDVLIAIL